jgi:hypothetical protein
VQCTCHFCFIKGLNNVGSSQVLLCSPPLVSTVLTLRVALALPASGMPHAMAAERPWHSIEFTGMALLLFCFLLTKFTVLLLQFVGGRLTGPASLLGASEGLRSLGFGTVPCMMRTCCQQQGDVALDAALCGFEAAVVLKYVMGRV